MILLFTNREDVHPTPVIEKLKASGASLFRFNTEDFLSDYQFHWWCENNTCDFELSCNSNGLVCKGSDVTAVWDRRPDVPNRLFLENEDNINRHNLNEAHECLSFMRYFLKDIPSIGSIVGDRYASSKMLQYKIANEVGLKTPETSIGNRKHHFDRISRNNKSLILKPLGQESIFDEDKLQQYVFYANKVESSSLKKVPIDAFSQTFSFIQNYIEKEYELRITMVGDCAFTCKIDSQAQKDNEGKIDWRQGYDYGIKWSSIDLPESVKIQCHSFLKKMNLNFGCFDLVVTPEGEYIFLECNPNGQWLWVEMATGLNISGAIASWLASWGNASIQKGNG